MEILEIEVDDIVKIRDESLKFYGVDSPLGVKIIDFTLEARVSCIFKRFDKLTGDFNDLATVHFLNCPYSTLVNVKVYHLYKVVNTKYRRNKFIRLLKRMTQEDRELLMSENCFCF